MLLIAWEKLTQFMRGKSESEMLPIRGRREATGTTRGLGSRAEQTSLKARSSHPGVAEVSPPPGAAVGPLITGGSVGTLPRGLR